MSFSRRGCVHACSDCKAPPPGTSCGVSVLPQDTQTWNNCKTKGGEGPGWQGYTGWSELLSRVNAWECLFLTTGVMGVLEPACYSYEGWLAIKRPNINRDRWDGNLFFLNILYNMHFRCYVLIMLHLNDAPHPLLHRCNSQSSLYVNICSAVFCSSKEAANSISFPSY